MMQPPRQTAQKTNGPNVFETMNELSQVPPISQPLPSQRLPKQTARKNNSRGPPRRQMARKNNSRPVFERVDESSQVPPQRQYARENNNPEMRPPATSAELSQASPQVQPNQ